MSRTLRRQLQAWDGVHANYLVQLYSGNISRRGFVDALVGVCVEDPGLQKPATWLLKHHCDQGQVLPNSLIEALPAIFESVENWEAKLHLLQLLPHVELGEDSIASTEHFVRRCLRDDSKFVRAWAYGGFFELTKRVPGLRTELELICRSAMSTESPSVRSKVRRILLALNKGLRG